MLWAEAESPGLPALFITGLNSRTSSVTKCPSVVWPWIWWKQRWWRQLSTAPVEVRGKGFYSVWGNTFSFFLAFVSFILILSVYNVCMWVWEGDHRCATVGTCSSEDNFLESVLSCHLCVSCRCWARVIQSCFASAFPCQAWKFIVGS